MSKTVQIILTRTVKIGGAYRSPGETVEVTRKQAMEILAAKAGREQPVLSRSPEKGGKKPKDEGGNVQGGAGEGQGADGDKPGDDGQGGDDGSGQGES